MSYSTDILTNDSPTAYYRMDEITGNIAHDISGHGYDAQLLGSFTLNQPGALIGDQNPSIFFRDGQSSLLLPPSLDYTKFAAFSLEFWIQIQGDSWRHIVVTCDGANTLVYLNGAIYTPGTPAQIEISSIFSWAGSYQPAYMDEVIVYAYTLSPGRILAHYQTATVIATPNESAVAFPTTPNLPTTTNIGKFGIGVYQSLSGGTTVGNGFLPLSQSQPYLVPYSGIFGGTYGYFIENGIRAPQSISYQPAQSIGLDAEGVNVVRGYPQITWTYGNVRPDIWYEFYNLYRRASYQPPGFQYLVLLQYPDPLQGGALTRVIASWDPLQHGARDVGSFKQLVLHFSYVGKVLLTSNIPIQTRI